MSWLLAFMAALFFLVGAFSLGGELFFRMAKTPEAGKKNILAGLLWLLMAFSLMSYLTSR